MYFLSFTDLVLEYWASNVRASSQTEAGEGGRVAAGDQRVSAAWVPVRPSKPAPVGCEASGGAEPRSEGGCSDRWPSPPPLHVAQPRGSAGARDPVSRLGGGQAGLRDSGSRGASLHHREGLWAQLLWPLGRVPTSRWAGGRHGQ